MCLFLVAMKNYKHFLLTSFVEKHACQARHHHYVSTPFFVIFYVSTPFYVFMHCLGDMISMVESFF
jgi:hypothetical protein